MSSTNSGTRFNHGLGSAGERCLSTVLLVEREAREILIESCHESPGLLGSQKCFIWLIVAKTAFCSILLELHQALKRRGDDLP